MCLSGHAIYCLHYCIFPLMGHMLASCFSPRLYKNQIKSISNVVNSIYNMSIKRKENIKKNIYMGFKTFKNNSAPF